MQIPFDHFEQYIHETMLKRGLSYYNNGLVQPPEEISPGLFEAIVEGSENYIVRLRVQDELIVDHSCSCPYDLGPVCKHVVALIFYLQQTALDLEPKVGRSRKTANKKKKTTIEQIDEIFAEVPVETLLQYLKDQVMDTPALRRNFVAAFAHYGKTESKSTYTQQLRAVINSVKRQGFIDYRAAYAVGKAAHDLLEKASTHMEKGNFQSAFYIATAVLEVMIRALDYADDSNGDIGDPIRDSMEILYEIAAQELTEDLRKMIFNYAIKAFDKRVFEGWDWHLDMLDLASSLSGSEKEADILLKLADKYDGSQYVEESLQQIKYNILQKLGRLEAEKFLAENITNPSLREIALERAFKGKEMDTAIRIAREGIECDQENKPGLVYKWYDWLLKIHIQMDDKAKVIDMARYLYLNARENSQSYYNTLKSYVGKEGWPDFVEELISELNQRERWTDLYLLQEIFKSENYWDRLLKLLEKNLSLYNIEENEKYLAKDYARELIGLYKAEIINYLGENTGRKPYRQACRYIRRMIKLGGREEAEKLVEFLKEEFPARRALHEELEKV